jgi:flagellar basal body rod protein FlgG
MEATRAYASMQKAMTQQDEMNKQAVSLAEIR